MADAAPATAPTQAIGYTQAQRQQWWLYENEQTPELQWPNSVFVYDQMRRTDSQCKAVLKAVMLPVLRTPWRIDPAGARPEVVQLVSDDLGLPIVGQPELVPARQKGRFSWTEHLRHALLSLVFGHSFFEVVYRVEDDGSLAHLAKLEYRPPTTIERIDVAKDGGLVAIKQYWTEVDRVPQPIPVSRLVAYVNEREGGNWLGTSLLRSAYKNWLLKDRLLRVQAQTIERNGMGIPKYKAQENASDADITKGAQMAQALRAGEAAGLAVPNGADIELMGVSGTLPDAKPVIDYHDDAIARAVLAHFLNLGSQTGSWALGATLGDFFTLSLQTVAQFIADVATDHIIEDLVDVNFGPDEPAPRLCFDEIGTRQQPTAEAVAALVGAGIIHPDATLEGYMRQVLGAPPAAPDGETPAPEDTGTPDVAVPDAPTQTGEYSVAASAGVDLSDEASWIAAAAGVDTHPGGEQLKHYWLFGEGAAKWATWTELYDHLRKYIKKTKLLKATVSKWYRLRYGHNPPRHHVAASALTASDEALAAFAEEFGELDADDEADDWELAIDALSAALDELSGAVAASFNPRQPRNPKGTPGAGRFRSMVDHLKDVIEEHGKGGGKGHPLGGFDREQLRRVARKRGISLTRGESRDSIAEKLLGDLRGGDAASAPVEHAAVRSAVRDSVARNAAPSGWADIADVRDDLDAAGYSRTEQDATLKAMLADEPNFRVIPLADSRNLKSRDRDAALVLGHDYNVAVRTTPGEFERPADEPAFTLDSLRADLNARLARLEADREAGLPEKALVDQEAGIAAIRRQIAGMDREGGSRAQRLADRQSKAGQKAAGVGVRDESPAKKARRERIEQLTNDALDARDRQDAQKAAADLPKLKGSAKQRDWAERIRRKALESIAGYEPARMGRNASGRQAEDEVYHRIASGHTDAKWWIDNRDDVLRKLRGEVSESDRRTIRVHEDAGFSRGEKPIARQPGPVETPTRPAPASTAQPALPDAPAEPPAPRAPQRSARFEQLSDDQLRRDWAELSAEVGILESDAQEQGNLSRREQMLFAELQAVRQEMQARGLLTARPKPVRKFGRPN